MAAKRKGAKAAIARLREIVEARLSELQAEIGREREELSAIDKEREMKAAHMMARTLEKVIELERKERLARERRAKQRKLVNDARRRQLAERIVALRRYGGGGGQVPPAAQTN